MTTAILITVDANAVMTRWRSMEPNSHRHGANAVEVMGITTSGWSSKSHLPARSKRLAALFANACARRAPQPFNTRVASKQLKLLPTAWFVPN
jgi:hypothetical protein